MNNTINMKENANVVHGECRQGIMMRAFYKTKALIERRNTIRQLNTLSDRMLLDIGIERAHIHHSINSRNACIKLIARRTSQPDATADFRRVT